MMKAFTLSLFAALAGSALASCVEDKVNRDGQTIRMTQIANGDVQERVLFQKFQGTIVFGPDNCKFSIRDFELELDVQSQAVCP